MADIGDIAGTDNYVGNVNLGGGTLGAYQLDVKPLMSLAAYTYHYNEKENADKQAQIEETAKQVADLTSYDLSSAIPKDRKYLTDKWNDMISFVRGNLAQGKNPMDFQENPDLYIQYHKMKNELDNSLKGGKVRSTIYSVRQKEVQDATDPAMKMYLQKNLDKEANDTDISTPIKYTSQYDLAPINPKAANFRDIQVTDIGRDLIGTRDYSLPDMESVVNQAVALNTGLLKDNINENDPAFKALPPETQDEYRKQWQALQASGKLEPIKSADNFNAALQTLGNAKNPDGSFKYKNPDGSFNVDALLQSGNPIVSGVAEQIKSYNSKMDEMTNLIDKGAFNDKLGGKLSFGGVGGLNKSSYAKINVDDGISSEDLIKMRIMGVTPAIKQQTKIQVTKLGLESDRLNLDSWFKHAEIADKARRTNAYVGHMTAEVNKLKTDAAQDQYLQDIYTANIIHQPTLFVPDPNHPGNKNLIDFQIKGDKSLPMFTLQNGNVSQLIPYNAKPIYPSGVDNDGLPKNPKEKPVGWSGGYYKPEFRKGDRVMSFPELKQEYIDYKQKAAAKGQPFKGGWDDYLKGAIQSNVYQVDIHGQNGSTNKDLSTAAQRIISNKDTKKGQAGVFDPSPNIQDASEEETTSTTTKDQQDNLENDHN